jgi:regulator of RNase E activity RraA
MDVPTHGARVAEQGGAQRSAIRYEGLMDALELQGTYLDLTTPHVADAMVRLGVPVRQAPANISPMWEGTHVVGRARPARHAGSVDVFLEALELARPGDVLVVDNGGREDEACVGDLVALEVAHAGLAGIVIWGLHRDSRELRSIRLPVFSQGTVPVGPQRLDPRAPDALTSVRFGAHIVTAGDFVLGDDDGVLFIPLDRAAEIAALATSIRETEREQAARMNLGTSFRDQTDFTGYLAARDREGTTFRQYLRSHGGAIEE